jgi:16S rRNA (guanine1516-N2)-methyltransferase
MLTSISVATIAGKIQDEDPAKKLSIELSCPYLGISDPESISSHLFVLIVEDNKIILQQTGRKVPGPIFAEFTEGSVDHRRKFGGGKGQMIAKAVGIKSGVYPQIIDATAGLGKDSFVLASLGASVTMIERSPIVHCLLQNGLQRAKDFSQYNDVELYSIIQRMYLHKSASHDYLQTLTAENFPDVIYLDPMFPEREKSAEVKKEMLAFHALIGKDEDADQLLPLAMSKVNYRVVVKRPRKAPFLNNQAPSFQLEGKSSRFDIYVIKKMPEKLNLI